MNISFLIPDIIFYIIGSISLICLLIIISSYFFQKSLQTYSLMQIFNLSLTTLFSTILLFIPNKQQGILCNSQALFMLWFDLSQYIWSFLITNSMYIFIVDFDSNNPDRIPKERRLGDVLFGYIFPFSYSILFYSLNLLGVSGEYCWISVLKRGAIYITYGIIITIICANIFYALSIVSYIRKLSAEDKEIAQNFQYKLLFYPLIQMGFALPGCSMRLLDLFTAFTPLLNEIFYYVGMIIFASQGIFILIAFKENVHWLKKFCRCKKNNKDYNNEDENNMNGIVKRTISDGTLLFDMPQDDSIFDNENNY